jgi:hypothetical protein
MPNRVIKSRVPGGATQLADMLTSLLSLELAKPSGRLYLISPRLGNMLVIASPFGQFRSLMPELSQTELRLSDVLVSLAMRGTSVRVLYRPGDVHTEAFIARLDPAVERRQLPRLEERGLITERFYLRGSLEFDLGGVSAGDESIEISTNSSDIGQALLDAQQLWERAQ